MRRPARLLACLIAFAAAAPLAAADPAREDLAKAAIARCEATATARPTPQQIVAKVKAAAALVEAEGEAAFARMRGDSPFIFGGTYVWVHDLDSFVMHMHPIKPRMEGRSQAGLTDVKGKLIFVEMNRVVAAEGCGWVDYVWPKPGQVEGSLKVSYVRLARHGGRSYVVGCGAYDITLDEIRTSGAR